MTTNSIEQRASADLLVCAGAVATMNPAREILRDGAVAVSGGRIVAVGKAGQLERAFDAARVIDVPTGLLTPGLIDGHCHAQYYIARGMVDDVGDVMTRVGRYAVPFEYGITHDEAYVSARANFAEMLRNGTTCFLDGGGRQPHAIAQAAIDTGIRGVVARLTSDVSGPFRLPIAEDVDTLVGLATEAVERWNGAAAGRIRARFSVDLPLSVSDELCAAVVAQASALDVGILGHFHGHTPDDHGGGRNPHVERYASLGVLSGPTVLAHIGWLHEDDIAAFVRHGVGAVHCPSQSMFGGFGMIGHGSIPELVEAGVPVGLGADAACVSRFLDLVRVMYLAACAHRDARTDPLAIGAHKAFEMATIDGARALRWDDEIGSLEVGKRADMVVFDTTGPEWQPRALANPIADLVYTATGHSTHTVVVDGDVVVDAGELTTIDAEAIVRETDAVTTSVFDRLGFDHVRPQWPVRA
ncbi:amidohydrolase family protein [Conexibacter woesei]|uniref:Amidohydrolase n=1 Tax=Conexibacter woesei (strain DSM 14684 / CCUG 47730 / CIP 108061 / JCM 11494 / NBRC 100937 / ID131577) TaxID=469383 RepID=D3F596_CONWI|nr:amidohydrolase family protein [Conexibacter woesei]ADB50563.1 amidohydrolase [Conexibacter woesei DSM 14684]